MSAPARSLAAFVRLTTDDGDWCRCLTCQEIKFLPVHAREGSPAWQRGADFLLRHQRGEHGPFVAGATA